MLEEEEKGGPRESELRLKHKGLVPVVVRKHGCECLREGENRIIG